MSLDDKRAEAVGAQKPSGIWFDLERWLAVATECLAASLILVEVAVLLAGVVARYVFHHPLTWSDELASILFLWLANLGAVVALRRNAHMRLDMLSARKGPAWHLVTQTLPAMIVLLFVVLISPLAWEYARNEAFITTPALGISSQWRALALAFGAALMAIFACLRLFQRSTWRQIIAALGIVFVVAASLWLARPFIVALGNLNLVIFFVVLVLGCIFISTPIAFAFGIATLAYLLVVTNVPMTIVVSRMDEGMSGIVLLSVPLFVFLGLLIEMTGMARAMVDFLSSLLGHVRGGLSYVLLGAMYLVSGISGSKAADMAAVAPVLFPEMKRRGHDEGELVALLSASGAMSETIPPSIVLIAVGSVTGISIAALFTGGLLPALVLALALASVVYVQTRGESVSKIRRASRREVLRALLVAVPALLLPVIIRTAVVEGVATATEVSTIGVAYATLAGLLFYRQFPWRRLYPILIETASLTGAILLIIGAATAMGWALVQSGFSRQLAAAMINFPGGKIGFLMLSIAAFAVLGAVLEGIPAIVLFGPLLFPAARILGIHEVQYAMVVVLAMSLGLFSPPFGVGFYTACSIGKVAPGLAIRRVWVYLAAMLVGVILIAVIPWLSLGFL